MGTVGEKFMLWAEELHFGELAAALNMPKDEVPEYIAARVDEERKELTDECKKQKGSAPSVWGWNR